MKKTLIQLLLLSAGICFGMMLTRSCSKQKEIVTEITIKDSTEVRVDTNRYEKPKPVSSIITGEYFTPYVIKQFLVDTVYVRDTIYLGGQTLYQEVKEYKDSTYYAKISGINAFLEEIRVYPKTITKYIYRTEKVAEKQKKWGIGISAGYCVTTQGLQPYVGVGLSYNIIQW